MAQNLVPAEAEALIALRGLLEEAVRRTADPTPVGRRVSAVLLDGAAEAAIATCLARFSDAPDDRDRLENTYSRLVKHLKADGRMGSSQGVPGWPDVKRLRRIRNNAQHHQIPPDHETLVAWSASMQRFVEAVVRYTFNEDLSLVARSETIRDPELRAKFAAAESHLNAGATVEAIQALQDVFAIARSKWDSEHRDATWPDRSHPMRDELGIVSTVESVTKSTEDLLSVAPFALDLGEYFWWLSLAQSVGRFADSGPISIEEAKRAMAFIFTWVSRWEAFSATYTMDRLGRRKLKLPPASPLPDGAPILRPDLFRVEYWARQLPDSSSEVEYTVIVGYAAGNGEDENSAISWAQTITESLSNRQSSSDVPWARADASYGGEIRVTLGPERPDPKALRSELESVLSDAAERKRLRESDASDYETRVHAQFEPLQRLLQDVSLADGKPAFSEIELRTRTLNDQPQGYVLAKLPNELRIAAQRRLAQKPSGEEPSVGTLHGYAFEVPVTTSPEEALKGAREAISLVETEKAKIDARFVAQEGERLDLERQYRDAFQQGSSPQ